MRSARPAHEDQIVMKTLFVAWKDTRSAGGWFPVGRLDADVAAERYELSYLEGALEAAKERGFAPFDSFPDFQTEHLSGVLFLLLAIRGENSYPPSTGG